MDQAKCISRLWVLGMSLYLTAAAAPALAVTDYVDGWIEKISDGDTMWVQTGRSTRPLAVIHPEDFAFAGTFGVRDADSRLKIRMLGMDAPETHLPTPNNGIVNQGHWGDKATSHLEKLVPLGVNVTVEDHGKDKYKRTLGRIYRGNQDIDLAMVRSGWAVTYIICSGPECRKGFLEKENVAGYASACDEARDAGKGIWNPKAPLKEMPFEFRLRMQERDPDKWVGDYRTKELVDPEDYDDIEVCNRVFFMKKGDALKLGFQYRG